MKNTILRFISIFGITMLLFSCFGTVHKLVVDPYTPAEQTVPITFISDTGDGSFVLKKWNNVDIYNNVYGEKTVWSTDDTKLDVPAGDNTFLMDVRYSSNSYSVNMPGIELRYTLEAGKKYEVKGIVKSSGFAFFKTNEFFIGIYDVTKKSTLLKEWKLLGTK